MGLAGQGREDDAEEAPGSMADGDDVPTTTTASTGSPDAPGDEPRQAEAASPSRVADWWAHGDDGLGISPASRRRTTAALLEAELERCAVPFATTDTPKEALIAVATRDRERVADALVELGTSRPDLQVRLGAAARPFKRGAAADLSAKDLTKAEWVSFGAPLRVQDYRLDTDGHARVLFVRWFKQSKRALALYNRAARSDWTRELGRHLAPTKEDRAVVREIEQAPPGHSASRADLIGDIDVVYTWVDASDPAWQRARDEHSAKGGLELPSADNDERYLDRDELRYSLRSLELFAPFVRHVYVVTADQVPSWLATDHERVSVISHREIFPDPELLPTFNSHAIEACLHRIPGLSENYLYLNDDVLFGREVTKEDFFTRGGLKKIRFGFAPIYDHEPHPSAIPTDWAAYNANTLLHRDFGLTFDWKLKHLQHPQKRSLLEELEERYPREFAQTRWARFRSNGDLAVPSMLSAFYALASGRGVEWPHVPYEYVYADTGRDDWQDRCDRIAKKRPKFVCLNATRYRDIDLEQQARNLSDFLEAFLPFPSSFERPATAE